MFRQKTTIVVGAGASCEIGLPSGEGVKTQITDLLSATDENAYGLRSDRMIRVVKARLGHGNTTYIGSTPNMAEIAEIKGVAARIRRGLPLALSIDNFLHTHQDDGEVVRLGKTTIAMAILEAESRSALFGDRTPMEAHRMAHAGRVRFPSVGSQGLNQSWYPPFAQLLMTQVQKAEAAAAFNNLRFVIFNYDRCLEQFLWMALQDYFDLSEREASDLLAPVEFIHPYGSLGPLPWQDAKITTVPLGNAEGLDLWQIGSRIRTFTESVASELEPRIKSAMEDAATIMLLGFGYLDQNVRLLQPGEKRNAQRVMSTALGISDEDREIVQECMGSFARPNNPQLMIEPGSCRSFFDRFRLQLSLR